MPKPCVQKKDDALILHFQTRALQSQMSLSDPSRLVLDYTRTMMGFLLFVPEPKKIAMIGLGGGSIAKYCKAYLPEAAFTAVDISPEVIALRKTIQIPDDDERFSILCQNGAFFMEEAALLPDKEKYNVILVDGFDEGGQPPDLANRAFYQDAFAALKTGGVLVVNYCADTADYKKAYSHLKNVFSHKTLLITAEDGANEIAFASRAKNFPPNAKVLKERLSVLEKTHEVDLFQTSLSILNAPIY